MKRILQSLFLGCLASSLYACGSADAGNLFAPSGGNANRGGNAATGGTTGGTVTVNGGNPSGGSATGAASGAGSPSETGGSAATTGGSNNSGSGGAQGGSGGSSNAGTSTGGATPMGGKGGAGASGTLMETGSKTLERFNSGPHCETVPFPKALAEDPYDIGVLVTLAHPDTNVEHDAVAIWVESIGVASFEVCLSEDADNDNEHPASRVDWLAYRISEFDPRGRAARENFGGQSGRACAWIAFDEAFDAPPHLQTSLNHQDSKESEREPATVWIENTDETGFMLCVEELSAADGDLDGVNVDWIAYPATPSPGFRSGELDFPSFTGTRCLDLRTDCNACGPLQLTPNHRRTAETTTHDPLLLWAENVRADGRVTICAREIADSNGAHDPHMSVDWLMRE